jgi:hypothetical protein
MTAEHVAGGDVKHVAAALTQAWTTIAVQKAKFDKDDSIIRLVWNTYTEFLAHLEASDDQQG